MTDTKAIDRRLLDWLEAGNARFPDRVYLESIDQSKAIAYGALYDVTNRIAQYLRAKGIGANDRVVLLAENSLEHLVAYLGVMRTGAVICTVHVEMNQVYFVEILNAVKPKLTLYADYISVDRLAGNVPGELLPLGEWHPEAELCTGFFADVAAMPDAPLEPVNSIDDDAVIFYTSGTEAKPKGCIITFREAFATAAPATAMLGMTEADRILEFRAMNWYSAQIVSGFGAVFRGATVLLVRKFSQSRYFDWVRKYRATIGVCNPTGLAMFLSRPIAITHADIPHLRFMTSSSAPLSIDQWQRFEAQYGIPVAQGYGASEIGWISGTNETNRRMGSVGKPFDYLEPRIVDETGKALPPGEIGEIELGGLGDNRYRHITDDGTIRVVAVGRMRTGDLGYMDEDGYLYITGRAKEQIIRGGANISPAEIDAILLKMPEISEAATIGVPDEIYGEEVVCYVVPRHGVALGADDVLAHCRKILPEFRMPKIIVFRDSLPRTERGKVNRQAILDDWNRTHASVREGEIA